MTRIPEAALTGLTVIRGHDGIRALSREWSEAWEGVEDHCDELIDAGEHVVSLVTRRARGRSSGIDASTPRAGVWTIRDGRIVRVVWFPTHGGALEAAGLGAEGTSSANVKLVRSILAAWERGEFGSSAWADPEIEYVRVDGPAPGAWSGFVDIARGMREMLSVWHEFRVTADQYSELDDERVLVLSHVTGRGKRSGLEAGALGAKAAQVFHLRAGKVTRIITYYDRERALTELGLARPADSHDP